jgi:hypothetical protein
LKPGQIKKLGKKEIHSGETFEKSHPKASARFINF